METTVVPREKLKELVEKNGESLLHDRDRCEGLLKDYCAGHRREISAIVGALEERVPVELKGSWQTAMTPEAMRARLVQRLEENRGLAPEIANYAVETWSYALGVNLGRSSDRVQDGLPLEMQNGAAGPLTAEQRAASDRPAGSSLPAGGVAPQLVPSSGGLGNLSSRKKGIAGGVGLLAAAAIAFALLHHPTPAPTPNPNPNPNTNPPAQKAPDTNPPTSTATPAATNGTTKGTDGKTAAGKAASPMAVGTSVVVRLDSDFNSDEANVGDLLPATVVTPLTSDGNVIVARGAKAQLKVLAIDKSGKMTGKSHVQFSLVGLTAHGKLLHVSASSKSVDGPSQAARTGVRTGIGAAAGAAVGALAGHLFHHAGAGAAAGAGAGGATGALTSKAAPVKVSAETVMQFRLTKGLPAGS